MPAFPLRCIATVGTALPLVACSSPPAEPTNGLSTSDARRFVTSSGLLRWPESTAPSGSLFGTASFSVGPIAAVIDWKHAARQPLPNGAVLVAVDALLRSATAGGRRPTEVQAAPASAALRRHLRSSP